MTLTPLHVAFVWIFKLRWGRLSFAALTIGSYIADVEPLISWLSGWSVFCGFDFPCTIRPDRLVMHSILGAFTVNVAVTMVSVRIVDRFFKLNRVGIRGFSDVNIWSGSFYVSAAIGSLSHVLVDWLHHPANPVLWPLSTGGSYYVGGLLLPFMSALEASVIVGLVAAATVVAAVAKALHESGHNFSLVFSNPIRALALITQYLNK